MGPKDLHKDPGSSPESSILGRCQAKLDRKGSRSGFWAKWFSGGLHKRRIFQKRMVFWPCLRRQHGQQTTCFWKCVFFGPWHPRPPNKQLTKKHFGIPLVQEGFCRQKHRHRITDPKRPTMKCTWRLIIFQLRPSVGYG